LIDAKVAREILLVFVFFLSFGPFVFFPGSQRDGGGSSSIT
jgi:hypothetical protein